MDERLSLLSGGHHREVIVYDDEGKLLGMATQTESLAGLWRSHVAEQVSLSQARSG
jgi:CBS-domain-containing membrane protein